MTTPPDSPIAPSEHGKPLIPHPDELRLPDEEVREFQRIMREECREELSFEDAKQRGLELLRLFLMFMDPAGYAHRLKEPPVLDQELVAPPPPMPADVPLPLGDDHLGGLQRSLQQLAKDLPVTRRRPTAWRWAVVCLWTALAHALASHRPAGSQLGAGPGELPRLFRAVAFEHPELPQVETSIDLVDQLRTTWVRVGVTRWPVPLQKLPGLFLDCLRVIHRLEPSATIPMAETEALME
jgi:hypothetical protein